MFQSDVAYDKFMGRFSRGLVDVRPAGGGREMRRVVREGGAVAMCTWDRQGMEMLAAVDRARIALGDES
jgi:hypothetical protein